MLARRDHKLQRLSRTSPRPGRRQSQQKSPLSDDAPPLSNDVPKKVDYSLIKAKKRPSNLPPVEIPKRPDAAEDQGSRYAKVKRVRVSSGADYTSEQRFNRSASPEDIRLTRSEKYALDDIGLAATAVLNAPSPTPALIAALRKAVQEAPFTKVSLSTRSKVTDPFLALLSSRRLRLPVDITLDALSLITRWSAGDLSPDLLRGITKTTRTKPLPGHAHRTTTSSALAKPYPFRRDPSTPGANGLTIGAWWPLQLCALRDGAHGSTEAGIAGAAATGAVSIILAGGYDDVDELTTVRYCGTRGAPASDGGDTGDASHGTRLLLQALRTGGAVRVLRSAKARAKSRYAPVCGYRYDGLYRVVEREWLDRKTAMMRFRMVRVPGQPEVRWRGEGERPTRVEVRAWEGAREAWRHVD
ncbi:PUA-like domain-containing protein [Geopyxis carbonaria]|nr:PUA-like domain-containing protein [Geopyxis carbonaria]